MTDTPEVTPVRSSSPELSAMTLPKLKEVATQLGIDGAAKLKKDALVTAIADLQAANREAAKAEREARREARNAKKRGNKDNSNNSNANSDDDGDDEGDDNSSSSSSSSNDSNSNSNRPNRDRHDRGRDRGRDRNRDRQGRDRGNREEREIVISEDDVLLPVGGIADIMESYAFIRTGGYLPSPNDVYISLQQVRRFGLRKGDVVTGAVRQPQEGERREKFNALVRLDTINGVTPDEARNRVEFSKLVPLYPQERLRLETEPNVLTTRVIDLISPIGKGQRGLIVSPPKAGKTMVLQAIANAITTNNPECHLMVVLVDERPEEVTDMERSVRAEVIASTFDEPAEKHVKVSAVALQKAKRLVECGHDVVILLDSITRLARAHNTVAPASGKVLSGGVEANAMQKPKQFFGAARKIENGGSLTILATALIETGSKMDEVIFEEFKGTGNMELQLDRRLANKRVFPAIDLVGSSTRRDDLLLDKDVLQRMNILRLYINDMNTEEAMSELLKRMRGTKDNEEFLASMNR